MTLADEWHLPAGGLSLCHGGSVQMCSLSAGGSVVPLPEGGNDHLLLKGPGCELNR